MSETADKDIQKTVLGCILFSGMAPMSECVSVGCNETWFTGLNCKIWAVMYELFSAGKHIDVLTVGTKLKGVVRSVYLDDCIDAAYSPSQIRKYARMLKAQYTINAGIALAQMNVAQMNGISWDQADDVISSIHASWNNLRCPGSVDEDIVSIGRKQIARWKRTKKEPGTVYWPLEAIAHHLPPLTDELIIIAAKPSVGKTAFVIQWLNQLANLGTLTSFNSLESKRERIWPRFVAHRQKMNMRPLTRGEGSEEAYAQADNALVEFGELPIRISDNGMNTDQLKAWGQTERAAGSRLLVIDNMRHIRPVSKSNGLVEQYQEISLAVKWLRDDTGLPTVLLHHLTEDSKTGKLSTAWGTDIWKDADILIYLVDNPGGGERTGFGDNVIFASGVDFEIRKDREGFKDITIPLLFQKDIQTFMSPADFVLGGESLA